MSNVPAVVRVFMEKGTGVGPRVIIETGTGVFNLFVYDKTLETWHQRYIEKEGFEQVADYYEEVKAVVPSCHCSACGSPLFKAKI